MRRGYGDQRVISAFALSLATLLMFLSVNVKTLVRADGGGGGGALASGGKIGCLFAPDLCEEYQTCLNDALFGKCASPGATGFVYTSDDISAEEAGRLRELLQTLASRGFSWEDDVTQRVLSRELSKLQKTPLSRPVSALEAGLRRGLQKYLQQVAKADGVYSPWKSADGTILLLAALQEYLDQTQPNELCRQRMTMKAPPTSSSSANQNASSRLNSVSSQLSDSSVAMMSSGVAAAAAANSSSPSRVSPAPWSGGEGLGAEPGADQSSMDISTGHMILSYMEDHLKNKDRLQQEWEGLCKYEAEPNASTVGLSAANLKKNRTPAVVAYDHCRFRLRAENNPGSSDYINASPIMDHDPRYPAYIATQGPLPSTVADFWQMVWESGAVVIVMLTPLVESGVKQCYHYWPDEGSNLYHIYEVNLVSEHVWCEDFLVRSFYLKNLQTNESRSVSQFHFHTWNSHTRGNAVPPDTHTLLQFRRKVNKCFRGRSCPIIVHCSDGVGRTGTYILIDMVLNRMAKGAKEIDIAATLEHLRDQRPSMVQTKEQFEFVLTTIAEEVNTILKTLPQ